MIVRFAVSSRLRWELWLTAGIVAAATVAVAAGSYFDRDDLVFVEYFRANPITPDVLVRSWFGHLMPGYIASVIAFLKVFALSWPAALVFIVLIHVGSFVALTRCIDAVVGPARINLIAGLAFTLSLGPLAVRLWWAATLNNMFALALGLAVLGCATRWVTTRRARHLIAGLILYALALSLSEKNLLFSLHIVMWCVFVIWRGRPVAERARELLRAWPLWLGLITLSLVDVIAFLSGPYVDESGDSPSIGFSLRFIAQNVFGGLVPSLFGIDMANQPTSWAEPRVVITCLLVAVFILWTILRARSNGSVWIFAAIAVFANAAVLSRRGELIGLAGSRQLRYLLESTALVWLAIGVVLVVALRAVVVERESRTRPAVSRVVRVFALVGGCALFVTAAGSWAVTSLRTIETSGGYAARAWVTNLEVTLPNPSPPLIDSPLPTSFGIPELHPYDMVVPLLPSMGWRGAQATTVLDGAWIVGRDGRAGPATVSSPSQQFTGTACTDGSESLPMPGVRTSGRTYIIVDVSAGSGDKMALHYTGGWVTVDRPSSGGRVAVYFPNSLHGDLVIDSQGGKMCVESIVVGDVVPEGSAG